MRAKRKSESESEIVERSNKSATYEKAFRRTLHQN
jgi:hypothetical protein